MPFSQPESSPLRLIWYVASPLTMAGGGERVIMEGLAYFESQGIDAALLLPSAMLAQSALFDGAYAPKIVTFNPPKINIQEQSLSFWQTLLFRFDKLKRLSDAITSLKPDIVIVNDPDACKVLWLSSFFSQKKLPARITFVHGSPFQFIEDQTKYARVFRRHFAQIRNDDPVYQAVIPPAPPSMTLRQRISLEIDSLIKYLALRRSQYAVTISEKNRREVELLYGHNNVVAASAGGFSKADFTYQRKQNMKIVFGLEDNRVILSLCRLVPKKRVDLSIQAFAEFIATGKGDDCILVIAGSGPHEEALKALVHEIQIEEKVKFIGYVPEHQLRDWYGSCDVFLNADNADYDLSLMMALALGCKVVVSSQYDFPKILDKTLRFAFISPPSVQGFARGMSNALNANPLPLNAVDFKELNALAWDEYFDTILSLAKKAIINRQGMN